MDFAASAVVLGIFAKFWLPKSPFLCIPSPSGISAPAPGTISAVRMFLTPGVGTSYEKPDWTGWSM